MSVAMSVIDAGMVTSVGNSAPAACAALRAGIRGVEPGNIWDWSVGADLNVGRPHMHQWWEGRDMLAEVVAPAIEECTAAAERLLKLSADVLPILLVVAPAHRPHRYPDLEHTVLADLMHKLARPLPPGSALIAEGRTGILRALEHAAMLLAERRAKACVIAGVESLLRQNIADHYMLVENRLLNGTNSNGFTLGEAGAAVLVAPSQSYTGPALHVLGGARANDPSCAGGTETQPAKGVGLTSAIRTALAAARMAHADLDLRISDANGEHWKFKEATFAAGRLDRPRPAGTPGRRFGYLDHWHPNEYTGDVGSAIGPLMLAWALHGGKKRYLPGPRVLVHAAEDNGDRVALATEFRDGDSQSIKRTGRP